MTQENNTVAFPADTSNTGANLEGASVVQTLKTFVKEPDNGFRLSRIISKKDKAGNKELDESLGVIVPESLALGEAIKLPALQSVLQAALEAEQDKLIRVQVLQGKRQIAHDSINLDAIEAYLASQPEAFGKLSAEKIADWFNTDTSVQAWMQARFAMLNGYDPQEDDPKLFQLRNMYRGLLQKLAEKSPSFDEKVRVKLAAMLEDVDCTVIVSKMRAVIANCKPAEIDPDAL